MLTVLEWMRRLEMCYHKLVPKTYVLFRDLETLISCQSTRHSLTVEQFNVPAGFSIYESSLGANSVSKH